jgi:hypothetical protein
MQVVPKLLRLTWFGFPLHYSKTGKWGFLVKKIPNEEQYTKYPEDFQIFDDSDCNEEKSSDECEKKETPMFPYEYGLSLLIFLRFLRNSHMGVL